MLVALVTILTEHSLSSVDEVYLVLTQYTTDETIITLN